MIKCFCFARGIPFDEIPEFPNKANDLDGFTQVAHGRPKQANGVQDAPAASGTAQVD